MVFGIVFIMVLTVAFAMNGQKDYKYDTLQSEVYALKKFMFNINVEFGRLRQQYDEIMEELRACRSSHNLIGTHSLEREGGESIPQDKKDDGKIFVLNTRAAGQAVNVSSHWNESQPFVSQCKNGNSSLQCLKGDKGVPGSTGLKGDIGTTGSLGLIGEKGPKGDKGDIGTTGLKGSDGTGGPTGAKGDNGQKGDKGEIGTSGPIGSTGTTGATGDMGPKGDKGHKGDQGNLGIEGPKGTQGTKGQKGGIGRTGAVGPKGSHGLPGSRGPQGATGRTGLRGQEGNKGMQGAAGPVGPPGDIGHSGLTGQKGEAGSPGLGGHKGDTGSQGIKGEKGETHSARNVPDISFSVGKNLDHHDHLSHVDFDDVYMNNGNDYDPSTGEFTCDVAGMYMFTLSANVSPGHEMLFYIKYNGHHWRYMAVAGHHHQTASVTALLRMKHGDIVTVQLSHNTDTTLATTTFDGVLLY